MEADILGVIAGVRIFQVFENTGKKPIEAVYVFPASTRAAVHGIENEDRGTNDRGGDR